MTYKGSLFLVQISFDGLTGKAQLREGNRHDPSLKFLKLKSRSLKPVGEWSPSKRLSVHDYDAFSNRDTINVTLRVTTVLVSGRRKLVIDRIFNE